MSAQYYDLLLWTSLLGFGYLAAKATWQQLLDVREATRIDEEEQIPEFFGSRTEDAISQESIRTLISSPNPDISAAAKRILLDRVTRTKVYRQLLYNIAGAKGTDLQAQALTSLRFLHTNLNGMVPHRSATIYTVVEFLIARLPENRARLHKPDTDWKSRTQAERDALFVLRAELSRHRSMLVADPQLVQRWVVQYPYGGKDASPQKKMVTVSRLIHGHTDDEYLGAILTCIHRTAPGRKQLRKSGLIGSAIKEDDLAEGSNTRLNLEGVTEYSDNPMIQDTNVIMPPETPGEQLTGEDEQVRLRRRRRNAMVVEVVG